ncbi:MAG: TraB/GumN family protein [Candidatus Competibacteraceae bacterium]|nr:TraB/GumN family protein [Candidatus Competibacteraceae bacterium]
MTRILKLFIILVVFSPAAPADETNRYLFWKVEGAPGTAYLLGSIHVGTPDMYPLSKAITQAFTNADTLVVEINLLDVDPTSTNLLFTRKGLYQGKGTLESRLEPQTWQLLIAATKRYNLPLVMLRQQKPWLAALTLTTWVFQQEGYNAELGVDQHFLNQAETSHDIVELESLEQQLNIFDQFSPAEQEDFLLKTLQEISQGGEYLQALKSAWKGGDTAAINELINATLQTNSDIYQRLITERNKTMTARIIELLNQEKISFVVVGAGHLVGEHSIVQELAEKGYKVERL